MTRISRKHAKELGIPFIDDKPKKNKYNNKKPVVDGIKFDSKKEARFYNGLKLLKKAGEIKDFELQPKFRLLDGGTHPATGEKYRPINYFADFKIIHNDDTEEIVDVKGYKTAVYKIKKKMLFAKYPNIKFREET